MGTPTLCTAAILGLAFAAAAPSLAGPPNADAPKPTRIEDALDKIEQASKDSTAAGRNVLVRMALDSPSARLRARAADALAKRQDRDEAVGSILWHWSNSNPAREAALRSAKALGRIPADRSARALWIRRQHEDATVEFAIRASWMAIAGTSSALDTIATTAKSDASPFVRALAARALGRIGGAAAAVGLLGAATVERSALVRDAIAAALASLPRDVVEADFRPRIAGSKGVVRTNLLWVAAGWRPSPSPELSAAVAEALATRAPDGVAAALSATPWSPETVVAARDRFTVADPVIRDAAIRSWVRQLAERPADAVAFARDTHVPLAARTALLAALAAVPTEAARDALLAAASEPIVNDADADVTATAIGALRRSAASGAKEALESLRGGSGQARAMVEAVGRAQGAETRRRAFVVAGRLDDAEQGFGALGFEVTTVPSGNELATLELTPEDVIVFDGPGEINAGALATVRRFLHLGGAVVLGAGLENLVWRSLLPDALDPTPGNLRLVPTNLGSQHADYLVYTAFGLDPTLDAALEPAPVVMVVPRPVPLRTAAARPLLWSAEMEVEDNGVGCVAAEVRIGCGRVLAIGAVLGLRAADASEGWFNRVRVDRTPSAKFPQDEAERRRVAYDWFGISPARIAVLGDKGYFRSDEPAAGMGDMPAARFLSAWLALR